MKFHENPSSGSRVVPCGQTDGRTDMKKLIVAFRKFENALTITDPDDQIPVIKKETRTQ
jgi:hypothetical protein